MEKVMNNPDLRGIIFSFFRDKYYKKCNKCNKQCRLNKYKTIHKYVSWTGFTNCHECFSKGFLGDRIVFHRNN